MTTQGYSLLDIPGLGWNQHHEEVADVSSAKHKALRHAYHMARATHTRLSKKYAKSFNKLTFENNSTCVLSSFTRFGILGWIMTDFDAHERSFDICLIFCGS